MPIDLTRSLKSSCGWSFASNGMNQLFASKLYTCGILTIMIIFLVMIIYPCKKNTPVWIMGKLGIYIFLVTICIMFVHDCVLYNEYKEQTGGSETEAMIYSIGKNSNVAFGGDQVSVTPATGGNLTGFNKCIGVGVGSNGANDDSVGGDAAEIFDMYGV